MKLVNVAIVVMFIIAAAGCQQANKAGQGDNNNNAAPRQVEVEQTEETDKQNKSSTDVAKHLVQLAVKEPGVKDAAAVVAGGYAVVGLDVDKDLDRARVGTIKYSVAEALKDDPYGANAVVTADADTVERLQEMGRKIQLGQPVQGMMEELAKIVGRLIPQVPDDMMNNDEPSTNNKNKDQLPQQNELNKQQKKQVPKKDEKKVPEEQR